LKGVHYAKALVVPITMAFKNGQVHASGRHGEATREAYLRAMRAPKPKSVEDLFVSNPTFIFEKNDFLSPVKP
jgi:hypothetical protein